MRTALIPLLLLTACGDRLSTVRDGAESQPNPATTLRYYAAAGLLGEHAFAGGVEYTALATPEATDTLMVALDQLAAVEPLALTSAEEQLAYFLNLYNLTALSGVVSARANDPAFDSVSRDDFALFRSPLVRVGGETMTLDQVENSVLRGESSTDRAAAWHRALWGSEPVDARIHFALNCASAGCPALQPVPWRAETLDADLDAATRAYLADPVHGAGPDGISELFDWFRADFETQSGSVEAFVSTHRDDGGAGVDFTRRLPYDWSLNELR